MINLVLLICSLAVLLLLGLHNHQVTYDKLETSKVTLCQNIQDYTLGGKLVILINYKVDHVIDIEWIITRKQKYIFSVT